MRRAPAPVGAPYPYMLIPVDASGAEALGKVPLAEEIMVTVKRDRSLPQHKLFWSVLQHVAQATKWETPERLLVALKVKLGRYDLMELPSGRIVPVPNSIAFGEMTQTAFQEFFDQAIQLICDEVLGGYDSAQLIAEVEGSA